MAAKEPRGARARRQFTDEFKASAVRLVLDEGQDQRRGRAGLGPHAVGGGRLVKQAYANRDGGKSGKRVRYAFIEAEKAFASVAWLCKRLGVSSSGFYAWRARKPSTRSAQDERIKVLGGVPN